MNRPPIAILRALLPFGAHPLWVIRDDEYKQDGSAWLVESTNPECANMILQLRGYRTDQTNAMGPVVDELTHYQAVQGDINIYHPDHQDLRSEIIYYVDAVVGKTKEYTRIESRELRVHGPNDTIWADLSLAWICFPWYTPGMEVAKKKKISGKR